MKRGDACDFHFLCRSMAGPVVATLTAGDRPDNRSRRLSFASGMPSLTLEKTADHAER
jgi:hypothetical protein